MNDDALDVNTTQLVLYQNEIIREATRISDSGSEVVLREPGRKDRSGMWTWVGEVQVIA